MKAIGGKLLVKIRQKLISPIKKPCPKESTLLKQKRLFGLCYAMDGGYKRWNPYRERHLAIFVNYF